jgi:hypothetical protein
MIAKHLLQRLRRRHQAQDLPLSLAADTTRLGQAAKRLLEDPVLTLAFELLEDDFVANWRNTPAGDKEAREAWYWRLFALRDVEAKLRAIVGDANRLAAEEASRAEHPELWAA